MHAEAGVFAHSATRDSMPSDAILRRPALIEELGGSLGVNTRQPQ
jgi:hypothetical protein